MRRAIALLPLVLVVAAGCGGDGDDSTEVVKVTARTETGEPLTKAEYIEQADAICRSYNEQLDPIREELEAQLRSRDVAGAADTIGEAVQVARAGVDELEALPKPPGDEAVLDQLEDLRQQSIALLARNEDAIRDEAVDRSNSIVRENESVDERSDRIATSYGFQECGQAQD